jgi:hypothetical protein
MATGAAIFSPVCYFPASLHISSKAKVKRQKAKRKVNEIVNFTRLMCLTTFSQVLSLLFTCQRKIRLYSSVDLSSLAAATASSSQASLFFL